MVVVPTCKLPAKVEVPVLVLVISPRMSRVPEMKKSLLMDEEAVETRPPKVERPDTASVEEAESELPTVRAPAELMKLVSVPAVLKTSRMFPVCPATVASANVVEATPEPLMESLAYGEVVPMPVLPMPLRTRNWAVPVPTWKLPEKVEVAVVEVAEKNGASLYIAAERI